MPYSDVCFDQQVRELAEASHYVTCRAELFEVFVESVAGTVRADLVQILEYVAGEGQFVLQAGRGIAKHLFGSARVPAGLLSQPGRAMLDPTGRPVKLEDFSRPHDWADDELLRAHGAKSGIVHKVAPESDVFGTLGVFWQTPRTLLAEEERFLARAAGLLEAGMARLTLRAEAYAWRSRSELLRAGEALLKVPAERDTVLLAAAAAGVGEGPGGVRPMADWCVADALEVGGRLPRLIRAGVAHAGGDAQGLQESLSVPLAPSAPHGAARVYATRQPELVRRCDEAFVRAVSRDAEHRRALEEVRPFSYVGVPVMGSHRFYGAIGFVRTEDGTPTPFDEDDLLVCSEFAGLVATAIERGEPGPDIAEAQEAVRSHVGDGINFTDRELEVLLGIATGERLAQIGRKHSISIHTVRNHKRTLCGKLGLAPSVPDAQIIAQARRRGVPNLSA